MASQWRERRAVGIYKSHGRQCARSADRKPGGRCGCPLVVQASRGQWRALPAGASLDEAKRALAKLRAERSGRPGPRSAAPLTVGELAALYFESRLHLKPSTRRADAQLFLLPPRPGLRRSPAEAGPRGCRAQLGDAAAQRGGRASLRQQVRLAAASPARVGGRRRARLARLFAACELHARPCPHAAGRGRAARSEHRRDR